MIKKSKKKRKERQKEREIQRKRKERKRKREKEKEGEREKERERKKTKATQLVNESCLFPDPMCSATQTSPSKTYREVKEANTEKSVPSVSGIRSLVTSTPELGRRWGVRRYRQRENLGCERGEREEPVRQSCGVSELRKMGRMEERGKVETRHKGVGRGVGGTTCTLLARKTRLEPCEDSGTFGGRKGGVLRLGVRSG